MSALQAFVASAFFILVVRHGRHLDATADATRFATESRRAICPETSRMCDNPLKEFLRCLRLQKIPPVRATVQQLQNMKRRLIITAKQLIILIKTSMKKPKCMQPRRRLTARKLTVIPRPHISKRKSSCCSATSYSQTGHHALGIRVEGICHFYRDLAACISRLVTN